MYASGIIRMGGLMKVLVQRGDYRLSLRYNKFSPLEEIKLNFIGKF